MEESVNEVEYLTSRVEHLQHERDALRKDVEQLCLQQAGPSYLAAATRIHFNRTAGLEQEIDSLNKKLAGCIREKQNLQEELSEAYRIKSQLADLHAAEVLKNMEAEKQLKFFQSSIAAAFSERDQALMESEKAKEKEEAVSERLLSIENRITELQSARDEEKKINADLQKQLEELKERNEAFEKVINKFYDIFQRETGSCEDDSWQEKCSKLLETSPDNWTFKSDSETSTSKYIASLENELAKMKNTIDSLQSNLRMGLQIEGHMKKNIQSLEKKKALLVKTLKIGLSGLRDFHCQQRSEIIKLLENETSNIKSMLVDIQEKVILMHVNSELKHEANIEDMPSVDSECKDVHITSDVDADVLEKNTLSATTSAGKENKDDASDTLAQALQEKVAALLLMSQQEERHLLERDVNQALQKKMEELQRNLTQVTNEKVQALVELAQLKLEYQFLQESSRRSSHGSVNPMPVHEQEGKLKSILKPSYLSRFMRKGRSEEILVHQSSNEHHEISARLKVENAALQESLSNLEHLTSSIQKLHITLLKVTKIYFMLPLHSMVMLYNYMTRIHSLKNPPCELMTDQLIRLTPKVMSSKCVLIQARDDAISGSPMVMISEALKSIITEAKKLRTAFGISLPVSWSADATINASTYENFYETADKVDPVCSTGHELVELLILSTQLLHENLMDREVD